MKTWEEVRDKVCTVMDIANNAVIKSNNYILWFRDAEQEVYAYDTTEPLRAVRSVLEKNPTYEFVHIDQMPDARSTREVVNKVRDVRAFREKLPMFKVATAAAAA